MLPNVNLAGNRSDIDAEALLKSIGNIIELLTQINERFGGKGNILITVEAPERGSFGIDINLISDVVGLLMAQGDVVACESLPSGGEASSTVNALFNAASSGPGTGDSNVGWSLGVGLHGVPQLTSGVIYGLNGGVEFRWGRLRAPIGANVMFKSKSREGYNYDESADRCRAPDGQFAEDEACTMVSTYALGTGHRRVRRLRGAYRRPARRRDRWRIGSFSGVHGAAGVAFNSIVVEVRAGPDQFGIASALSF